MALAQPSKYATTQDFILSLNPKRLTRRTFNLVRLADGLVRSELIAGQIDLDTTSESIPTMEPALLTIDIHLGNQQPATQ